MESSSSLYSQSQLEEPRPHALPVNDNMAAVFATHTALKPCSHLVPHLRPTDRILDVGCGPGSITIDLAQQVPSGHVVGLDKSATVVEQARKAAAQQGVTNVTFKVGDAHDIRLPGPNGEGNGDETFDVVHAHMVLMHLSNPVQAFREMRRLVKTGGLVATADIAKATTHPESATLKAQFKVYDRLARDRGAHPDAGKYSHVWASQAGFKWEEIQYSTSSWGFFGRRRGNYGVRGQKKG